MPVDPHPLLEGRQRRAEGVVFCTLPVLGFVRTRAALGTSIVALLLFFTAWHGGLQRPPPPALLAAAADDELPLCVFIHGAGSADSAAVSDTDVVYWGRVHEHTPVCAARRFLHEETLHVTWEDEALQSRVCQVCGATGRGEEVSDVLIFAHSMGNLILAGALEGGVCRLGPSAAWLAVASPWRGSRAADKLPEVCAGKPSLLDPALRELADRQGFCQGPGGTPSAAYSSLRTDNAALARISHWEARVNASLCGSSAFGLWSLDSFGLQAMNNFASFGEPNDGAVPTSNCHPPGMPDVGRTFSNLGYTAAVNHYDVTCRHGDGSWGGNDRKPCSWYAEVSRRVRRALSPAS